MDDSLEEDLGVTARPPHLCSARGRRQLHAVQQTGRRPASSRHTRTSLTTADVLWFRLTRRRFCWSAGEPQRVCLRLHRRSQRAGDEEETGSGLGPGGWQTAAAMATCYPRPSSLAVADFAPLRSRGTTERGAGGCTRSRGRGYLR